MPSSVEASEESVTRMRNELFDSQMQQYQKPDDSICLPSITADHQRGEFQRNFPIQTSIGVVERLQGKNEHRILSQGRMHSRI